MRRSADEQVDGVFRECCGSSEWGGDGANFGSLIWARALKVVSAKALDTSSHRQVEESES